jgi:hypothetical protein
MNEDFGLHSLAPPNLKSEISIPHSTHPPATAGGSDKTRETAEQPLPQLRGSALYLGVPLFQCSLETSKFEPASDGQCHQTAD